MLIDIDKIFDEWENESKITEHLDDDSRKTPKLHAKYLRLFHIAKDSYLASEHELAILKKNKWLWYTGKISQEELEELGWEPDPTNGLKLLKTDLPQYYAADPDLQKATKELEYRKNVCDAIKEILDSLKWRHQTIRNMIEYLKFEAGG